MPYQYADYIPRGEPIPLNVFKIVSYTLKDYNRMLKERNNILFGTVPHDNQPRAQGTADPTGNRAVRLAALSDRVDSIDAAIHDTNAAYTNTIKRDDIECFDSIEAFNDYGYFCYALYDPEEDREPSTRTWKRYRAAFAYKVAQNLHLV